MPRCATTLAAKIHHDGDESNVAELFAPVCATASSTSLDSDLTRIFQSLKISQRYMASVLFAVSRLR